MMNCVHNAIIRKTAQLEGDVVFFLGGATATVVTIFVTTTAAIITAA
jgi:hypothetical protein